ncbi:hypothetical protein T4A_6789 [Trichinella pseudospiralis]|uniref:Uncharacterized protein n=1 Tax=Trichinella pseudospiralis TaxID=6337 RepID=A0A0V1DLA6_TRIPS|nr:hypothetical protein T4A_6789 [Trichinella pseudospiralis]
MAEVHLEAAQIVENNIYVDDVLTYAFDNVGIHFAGPLYVKEGRTISKIYICLFTCMATRAIHLEPTSDMTTQSFFSKLLVEPKQLFVDSFLDEGNHL